MTARNLANSIRPLMEAAARSSRRRPAAAIDERIVRALATREHIGRRIVDRLLTLSAFTPDLRIANVLADGAWVWSLRGHVPARSPRPRRPLSFCRLEFGLRIDTSAEWLAVDCRATAHDADLPALYWESAFAATDWEAFDRWIEKAVVAFASAYFGGRSAS